MIVWEPAVVLKPNCRSAIQSSKVGRQTQVVVFRPLDFCHKGPQQRNNNSKVNKPC